MKFCLKCRGPFCTRSSFLSIFHGTSTAVRGKEGDRCLQRQPKGVSGVLQMDPKQISAGLTCLTAELSPTAKVAWAAPAGAGSGYWRVLGALCLLCQRAGLGPARRRGGRLAGCFKGTQRVGTAPFSHTPPSYFFFMKTFTRNLISDRGSKFHARIYFTKHVIFRSRKTFN